MAVINIRHPEQRVGFSEAVRMGMGREQGLFMPEHLPPMEDVAGLLSMDFVTRSTRILGHLVANEIDEHDLGLIVESAFDFPAPLVQVDDRSWALELYHGTSLAFKDFGARFMARVLAHARNEAAQESPVTILTATSGDTGAAVAQAFHHQPGIEVVILYPSGRITPLQEKLFCTLGGNIRTFAVEDDFDACQAMVKSAFDDTELVRALGLNSANSINIARLLAQVCYYFEAIAQFPSAQEPVFSVPSGNFGNVTAGLIASVIGLPARRFIAATNSNDTVPRYLASGRWDPRPTVATMTNAMDISRPNNFQRVLWLAEHLGLDLGRLLVSRALSDVDTGRAMETLFRAGYLADPHSALGWRVLQDELAGNQSGIFLCTAHPAKFREDVEKATGSSVVLPGALAEAEDREILSTLISSDYRAFRSILLQG